MIGRFLLCLPLFLLGGCPPLCFAQIALDSAKVQVVSGLENPRIVGGVVMFDGPSRPLMEAAALIELKLDKHFDKTKVEAENVSTFEVGNLTQLDDTHWLLRGAGKFRLYAIAFGPDLDTDRDFVDLGPTPAPPVPPSPTPTPTPTPDGEAPIPEPGFRVLVVYESADMLSLPPWFDDADFRAYLNTHCVKGPDGKTPEWRKADPDASPQDALWAKALSRPRASLPWILISDGKHGYEGPLPTDKAEALKLLQKYGGQ